MYCVCCGKYLRPNENVSQNKNLPLCEDCAIDFEDEYDNEKERKKNEKE